MLRSEDRQEGPDGSLQVSSSNTQLLELNSQVVSNAELLDEQAAAADDSGIQLSSRHLHFHMHMHAAPPVRSLHVAVPSTLPQLAPPGRQEWPASAKNSFSVSPLTAENELRSAQQLTTKQHGSKLQQQPGEAPASVPQQRRSRWRRLLRAMAITGGATAVALAGAGIAAAALAPRMEHLETRYHQVGPCCVAFSYD
jgi:hypothetical protein